MNPSAHHFESHTFHFVIDEAIEFFNQTPIMSLPPHERFLGPGVYALYYLGEGFSLYSKLADITKREYKWPIYVGKAVPSGWRTGRTATSKDPSLYLRLREHARSIDQVKDFQTSEFRCRFMLLKGNESNLISTVESSLIRKYQPIWNVIVDGFGNHDPGKGRYNQAPSEWDTLHPGRYWAARLTGQAPEVDRVESAILKHFQSFFF